MCSGKSSDLLRFFAGLKKPGQFLVCVLLFSPEPLFVYLQQKFCLDCNKFFLPKRYFYLANKYTGPCLARFYKGLKWCISREETLHAVTTSCPSAFPLESSSVSCGIHLGLLLLASWSSWIPSVTKPAGFSRSLWSAGSANKVIQFSLFPSCSSSHNLLPVLLRCSVALLLCPDSQSRWKTEVQFSNVLWGKLFIE